MRHKAFGAIDLLLGLLIMAIAFIIGMNVFKNVSLPVQNNDAEVKTVKEHINDQITEIEDARQKAAEFEKEMQDNF